MANVTVDSLADIQAGNRVSVRTSGNRVYVFLTTGDPSIDIWKGNVDGEPASFTRADFISGITGLPNDGGACVIDSNDIIHCIYYQVDTSMGGILALRYVTFDTSTDTFGTPQSVATLDNDGAAYDRLAIAIDANDEPHVIWKDANTAMGATTYSIWYSKKTSGSWATRVAVEQIEDNNSRNLYDIMIGEPTSAIGDDRPLIIVESGSVLNTINAYHGNALSATAFTEAADITGSISAHATPRASFAIDTNGRITVAFVETTTWDLMAVEHLASSAWGTWETPFDIDTSVDYQSPSIAIIGTDRYIFVEDSTNNDLNLWKVGGSNSATPYFHGDLTTRAYYFDGHTAITDVCGQWSNEANAWDGSTSTFSTHTGGWNSGHRLEGHGTTAPSTAPTSDSIVEVRARVYRAHSTDTYQLRIHTDGQAETLLNQSIPAATASYSSWYTLSAPAGGWSWSDLRELECDYFPNGNTSSGNLYAVEFEVLTSNLNINNGGWVAPVYNTIDGSTGTFSQNTTIGSDKWIEATGTTFTGTILNPSSAVVEVRTYGVDDLLSGDWQLEIYDGGTKLGSTILSNFGTSAGWSSYDTITAPAGGWTASKIAGLRFRIWCTDASRTPKLYRVELRITDIGEETADADLPNVGTFHAVKARWPTGRWTLIGTYYFDGHDQIIDNDNSWENDTNAFDGSTATVASEPSGPFQSASLEGHGTTAPTTNPVSDRISISKVRVRYWYENDNGGFNFKVYTDGQGQTLANQSNIPSKATPGWSAWYELSVPTGGWTWAALNGMEVEGWPNASGGGTQSWGKTEFEVYGYYYDGALDYVFGNQSSNVLYNTFSVAIPSSITHTTDSYLAESSATTYTKTHTTDSILKALDKTVTHTTDSILKEIDKELTHTTDSVLVSVVEKTHTTDSILKEIDKEITHTTDSILKEIDKELTHTTDSLLFTMVEVDHTTDSILKEIDKEITHNTDSYLLAKKEIAHTTDSILVRVYEITHNTDSYLLAKKEITHDTDSVLKKLDNEVDHTTDSIVKEIDKEITHNTDSYLLAKKELTHTTDSIVKEIGRTVWHTTDSIVGERFPGINIQHTTSSVLKKLDTEITHTTDSILQEIDKELTHTTDSYLLAKKELTHTTDSVLKKLDTEITHTTDSFLSGASFVTHTTDSILKELDKEITHTTDSILQEIDKELTHTTDSILLAKKEITHTTDSILKELDKEITHTTDSVLVTIVEIDHTTDSILLAKKEITHTTDSILKELDKEITHTTDSIVKELDKEITHTTDSYLLAKKEITHTTDSILKEIDREITHTTDSYLVLGQDIDHTTDSVLKDSIEITHTTDSFLSTTGISIDHTTDSVLKALDQTATHTTDSFMRKRRTISHVTDSYLEKQGTVIHTTDSILTQTITKTHTTDSVLAFVKVHTTDSVVYWAIERTHTTDSYIVPTGQGPTKIHDTDSILKALGVNGHCETIGESVWGRYYDQNLEDFTTYPSQGVADSIWIPVIDTAAGGAPTDAYVDVVNDRLFYNTRVGNFNDTRIYRDLGFTLADAGNWVSRFKLDFLAIQRLSGTEKCAITYAQAGTGSGYASIDCMGLRIETDSFTTNLYTVSKNSSSTSTALFSYTPQQGETLGVEFVKVSLTEFRVSIYTEDFSTLIESQTVTGSNVQYATALDTFVVGNSNQSGTEPSTVQTIAVRDIKVKFDQAVMLESKQNYCHLTDSTVKDTFTKTHTTDSVLARGVHHFTDSVVVGPAPPITHTTDSIVQKSDNEIFHTTDIYIKWSVKHTTDSLFLGKQTEVHTTDSVFKGAVTTNHTTDSFLADNATTVTVSHTTDSILKEINKERTHLTDSVLALRVPITHTTDSYLVGAFLTHTTDSHLAYVSEPFHKTDSILKAILPVTHTTDSFVADRPLVTHTTDSVLKTLDQELTQTTDSYLNATKSVTHDTDSIVKQLTQLTHTTDSSLTGAVVVNHTTDSFLKSVTLPEAPEIQVSIRSIGDIQVGIMSDGDIQTYLNSIGDIEVYG